MMELARKLWSKPTALALGLLPLLLQEASISPYTLPLPRPL